MGAVSEGFNAVVEGVSRNSDRVGPAYGLVRLDVPNWATALNTRGRRFVCSAYTYDFMNLSPAPIDKDGYDSRPLNIGCCEREAVVRRVDMKDNYYLGLAGPTGVGKTSIANYIAHRFGMQHLICSEVIEEELRGEGVPITKENLQKKGEELRAAYGRDIVVNKLLDRAVGATVFDGIYDLGEAMTIKRLGGDIIFIDCNEEVRQKRLAARSGPKPWEGFKVVDYSPEDRGAWLIRDAIRPYAVDTTYHHVLVNRGIELLVSSLLQRVEIKREEVHIDRPRMIVTDTGKVFFPEEDFDPENGWSRNSMAELPARVGVARSILFGEHEAVA